MLTFSGSKPDLLYNVKQDLVKNVAKKFNLTLLPLYRVNGAELSSPPGLLALSPPRRKARTRGEDRLFVHLNLSRNTPFSTVNYLHMTSHAAEAFYQSAGSVTSALRNAAITLNGELLEENMAFGGQGYSLGQAVFGAVHREQLYLLIAGGVHLYWIAPHESKEIFEPKTAGRGFGLSQAATFYLTQLKLQDRGRFLISSTLSKTWKEILLRNSQSSASLETLRNVLLRQSVMDVNAVLADVELGRGEIKLLKTPRSEAPTLASITRKIEEEPKIPEPQIPEAPIPGHSPEAHITPKGALAENIEDESPALENESKPPQVSDFPPSIPRKMPESEIIPEEDEVPAEEFSQEESPNKPKQGETLAREGARAIAKGMQATRKGNDRLKDFFGKMLPRILPASNPEAPMQMPAWVMGLIAVIIPLIVVTIASVVYFQFGRDLQFETHFREAEIARVRATEEDDPVAKRIAWQDVLHKLDQAEEYDSNADSTAMRNEARTELDTLLGIARVNFSPAVSDLPKNINIIELAATDTELFMLDSLSGNILRAYRVDNGYQYDADFLCQSGEIGGKKIEALKAMVSLPANNAMAASVMGMDRQGNLIYCAAQQTPQTMTLAMPPITLKEITAIALENNVLYVLDAPSKEVWVYTGQAYTFNSYPTSFFEQAPQGISIALDMSVRGADLYLLLANGDIVNCTYSLLNTVPTRCINPAELSDPHPAAGGNDTFKQSLFTQLHLSKPPDTALLLLASNTKTIFKLSPRSFELQTQIAPPVGSLPEQNLTAMTTNAGRTLFVAQGNQVYVIPNMP